jgi:REP element-mobilizing transposase RayT
MLTEGETYFVTSSTVRRKPLLQSQRMAQLFIDTLEHYRRERKFALHEFVVMPDHFHALLTVAEHQTLERVVQFIKADSRIEHEGNLVFTESFGSWDIMIGSFAIRRNMPGCDSTFIKTRCRND